MYSSVRVKFTSALLIAIAWASFSIWAGQYWFKELAYVIGGYPATFLIALIAIIPGFMNAFIFSSLLFDRRPAHKKLDTYPGLSILIAAFNEEKYIAETIDSIHAQMYPGKIEIIVVNDGSSDATASIVAAMMKNMDNLHLINIEKNAGKAHALNQALVATTFDKIITLDADSYLFKDALTKIVECYENDSPDTCAIAGTVLVRNSRDSWLTKSQEWDYFNGIATVKRVQSMNQGTLVAQGAFSLYDKTALQVVNGWPETVGEDIVLTWALLKKGYRVGYCEDAIAFTVVPHSFRGLVRQRQRWARGMIEAFKFHPGILFKKRLSTFFVWWDLLFPLMDSTFTFVFVPSIVLALFGYYWIVGPMTLSLFPIALLINWFMYRTENKIFTDQGLKVRHNFFGFFIYLLPYSMIVQPAAVLGYATEILGLRKTWGTK
jgi:biofilm PGA synthesis N-glycosyltransferase PgaC